MVKKTTTNKQTNKNNPKEWKKGEEQGKASSEEVTDGTDKFKYISNFTRGISQ